MPYRYSILTCMYNNYIVITNSPITNVPGYIRCSNSECGMVGAVHYTRENVAYTNTEDRLLLYFSSVLGRCVQLRGVQA